MLCLERMLDWERDTFLFLNSLHTPYLDSFMYLLSTKFSWICVIVAFLVYLFYRKPLREALLVILFVGLCVLVCDQLSSHIAKPFFTRFRPTHHPEYEQIVLTAFGYRGGLYGFFSGHASNFFAVCTLTALIVRRRIYSWIAFPLALLVSYSRIYLGVHFISDIVVGIVVGVLTGWGLYMLYRYIRVNWVCPTSPKDASKVFTVGLPFWCWSLVVYILFLLTVSLQVSQMIATISTPS